jgi:hypothetical protein
MAALAADRNLLFGILAAQMNFVARDALIAPMHAWVVEKSKPLGRILVEQQALSLARHDLLEHLVDDHLAAHSGDAEKSLVASDGLGALRAELERVTDPEIRATLDRVRSRAPTPCDSDGTLTYAVDAHVTPSSRFLILRPHARGGTGQISVALDSELNREVALKELGPERADDPDSRAWFLLEAEITGRLEHPGVVPVYGLGWDAQGHLLRHAIRHCAKPQRSHRAVSPGRSRRCSPPRPAVMEPRTEATPEPVRAGVQRGGLRPQPGGDPPRSQPSQHPARPVW